MPDPSTARNYQQEWQRQEDERLMAILGDECPQLQMQLYRALENESSPIAEHDAIEIVYHLSLTQLRPKQQARVRDRLRQVQRRLNDRFRNRRLLKIIVRPRKGWLFMYDRKDKSALDDAKQAVSRPRRRGSEQKERKRNRKAIDEFVHGKTHATVTECLNLIRRFLSNGPRSSDDLNQHCSAQGCREKTIRNARQKLRVQAQRVGFGGMGQWMVIMRHHKT